MNKPKKHHYVPKLYLKYFTFNSDKNEVWVKSRKKYMKNKIQDICIANNLYNINAQSEADYDNIVETNIFAQDIEKRLAPCYESINRCYIERNYNYNIDDLLFTLVIQLLRTPNNIQYFSSGFNMNAQKILSSKADKLHREMLTFEIDDKKSYITKQAYINIIRRSFFWIKKLRENYKVEVIFNYTGIPFITTDNPVYLYNKKTREYGLEKCVLINAKNLIWYPLTPGVGIKLHLPNGLGKYEIKNEISTKDFVEQINKKMERDPLQKKIISCHNPDYKSLKNEDLDEFKKFGVDVNYEYTPLKVWTSEYVGIGNHFLCKTNGSSEFVCIYKKNSRVRYQKSVEISALHTYFHINADIDEK